MKVNIFEFEFKTFNDDSPSMFTNGSSNFDKGHSIKHIPSGQKVATMYKGNTPPSEIAEQTIHMLIQLINKINE